MGQAELPAQARIGGAADSSLGAVPAPAPSTAEVREWARRSGLDVADQGRLHAEVLQAWRDAHEG